MFKEKNMIIKTNIRPVGRIDYLSTSGSVGESLYFYDADDLVENRIPKEDFEKHYRNACDMAAALERMLNGKKYTT